MGNRQKIDEAEAEQGLSVATTWEFVAWAGQWRCWEVWKQKHLLTVAAFYNNKTIPEDIPDILQNTQSIIDSKSW